MASRRHLSRVVVMLAIFNYEFRNGKKPDLTEIASDQAPKLKDLSFAEQLFEGILEKQPELYKIIQNEAPEWPIDRIAPVDRAILEIGTYEIIYSKDVPPVVAIDEAVELAKTFGDLNSGKFVNGVLSTIMYKYRKPEEIKSSK